jgi:predicted phosphodiesterase
MPNPTARARARTSSTARAPRLSAHALPLAKHEEMANALGLPEPHAESYERFEIDTRGRWLVISDIHAPYHDRATLELAVTEAKRRGVAGVLFNGDTLDSHEVSSHDKEPGAPRYVSEIETGQKLFRWFRAQLPRARFVVKQGNHEDRLERYIIQRAPALFGLEGLDLPTLLHLADVGAEWVHDKRVIALGKLPVLHGHEYRGSGGVNPARWLFLRTQNSAICGHFHRTSEHGERDVIGREQRTWTTGCACYLFPRYARLNQWNHGFAFVDVAADGTFWVDNRRVRDGKIA